MPLRVVHIEEPISIIVIEGLIGMIKEAISKNLYANFLVGEKKVPINLLQYADDTIFI